MGGQNVMPGREELVAAGLPDYPSPGARRGRAAGHVRLRRLARRPPRVVTRFPVNRRRVERVIQRHLKTARAPDRRGRGQGDPARLRFQRASPASSPPPATKPSRLAGKLGYPVVMKIASPDIIHKSDIGGVKLNLNSPAAVRDAFDLMMLRISASGARRPHSRRLRREDVRARAARSSWA